MNSILLATAFVFLTSPPTTQSTTCICADAKLKNAWCTVCKVGYVAGVSVRFPDLHEVMDTHGHDLDPRMEYCESCAKAIASDGFCERCGLGYLKNQLYFSQLTYLVAKGKQEDVSRIACGTCKKNAEKYGWCDRCGLGRVGNVFHSDRVLYKQTCEQYDFLMAALEVAKRCELCACCMFTKSMCPKCRIDYSKGGIPIPPATQPMTQPSGTTGGPTG